MLAAVLTDIGGEMARCPDYATTAASAAVLVANVLGVTHSMVLRLLPAGDTLLLQGGVGWGTDMVGRAVFDASQNTLVGLALAAGDPLLIDDFQKNSRFPLPAQLSGYGLRSALCVRIPCAYQSFGVVAAFSTEPRTFSQNEISYLRAVANMLAVTCGCQRTGDARREDQEKIAQAKREWEATADALPHFICLLDDQRRVVRANRSLGQWVPEPVRDVRGHTVHELLHPGCDEPSCYLRTLCDDAWIEVLNGRHMEMEVDDSVLKRSLEIQLQPTVRRPGVGAPQASQAVVVFQDITKIKHAEAVLKRSNVQLEHLVQARTEELVQANEQLRREIAERQRVEQELRYSENELRLLSAQLLTAQEMERKRIASELHDGIGQSLSALKFCMENAIGLWTTRHDDRDINLIKGAIPKLQAAIDEVRRISMNLRPSTLDDLGILPTIAWFCREFHSIYDDIRLDTYIDIAEEEVPVPLKTVIYRIMQEALNNVAKHAQARCVHIQLRKTARAIEFLVRDNGAGFDLNALMQRERNGRGSGITGMRERAEFSGGTFFIVSDDKRGTTIRTTWPCHH